jgi:hypothetical protein
MAAMITVTDRITGRKVSLTNGMIADIRRNTDGTAEIELEHEDAIFNIIESFDWILAEYGSLDLKAPAPTNY